MQIELFCTCQMPEIYDDMVECDTCGDWYHPKCSNCHQKANNGTVINVSSDCFLTLGCHNRSDSDAKFSRKFFMGMPNSLFVGGYQKH